MSVMVDVTGTMLRPDGSPAVGDVSFELVGSGVPSWTALPTYSGGYVSTPLAADGTFALTVVATDDPELTADGDTFSYALQLKLDGEFYWRQVLVPGPGPYTLDELPRGGSLANATDEGV